MGAVGGGGYPCLINKTRGPFLAATLKAPLVKRNVDGVTCYGVLQDQP